MASHFNLLITRNLALENGMHGTSFQALNPMFRFDQMIRGSMVIRDVKQRFPQTQEVFEQLHFRSTCDDCDIETVARKNGLNIRDVVDALNAAAFGPEKADR